MLLGNGGLVAEAVAIGDATSCAVVGGQVRCWGSNVHGALGTGTPAPDIALPMVVPGLTGIARITVGSTGHACAASVDHQAWCWGSNFHGQLGDGTVTDAPTPVAVGLSNIAEISAGDQHTCAVRTDGTVWCWGGNDSGQLGTGDQAGSLAPRLAIGACN